MNEGSFHPSWSLSSKSTIAASKRITDAPAIKVSEITSHLRHA